MNSTALARKKKDKITVRIEGCAFGGPWIATLELDCKTQIKTARDIIQSVFDLIDQQMSPYRAQSDINRFNRLPVGVWTELPEHLMAALKLAEHCSNFSQGAFDHTLGESVNALGFGPTAPMQQPVSISSVEYKREPSGRRMLAMSGARASKIGPVTLDLCGIAKGYAADIASQRLLGSGICTFLLNVSGDVIAKGCPSDGVPWRVGIELPVPNRHVVFDQLLLHNDAIATSGTYQNYGRVNDETITHIVDSKTGYSVNATWRSVVVCAETCAKADAMATALLVMGVDTGSAFANEHAIDAVFLTAMDEGVSEVGTGSIRQRLVGQTRIRT